MKKNTTWTISTDEVGQRVLRWRVASTGGGGEASADPFERTYDFLRRLDVTALRLEEEAAPAAFDPYDTGNHCVRALRR